MEYFVERTIHAGPEEIAEIMFDPAREGDWMGKGAKAELLTPGPLAVGSRVRHDAGIFGWKMSFITEVKAIEPGRRLEMEIVESADHGVIIYLIAPTAGGSIATIHVRDEGMARMPHAIWARKQQAQESLAQLAKTISRAHAA